MAGAVNRVARCRTWKSTIRNSAAISGMMLKRTLSRYAALATPRPTTSAHRSVRYSPDDFRSVIRDQKRTVSGNRHPDHPSVDFLAFWIRRKTGKEGHRLANRNAIAEWNQQ